jgi:hypothetical protein
MSQPPPPPKKRSTDFCKESLRKNRKKGFKKNLPLSLSKRQLLSFLFHKKNAH